MIINIELFDGTFIDLDTKSIDTIGDHGGYCIIKKFDGTELKMKDSYSDIYIQLNPYMNFK